MAESIRTRVARWGFNLFPAYRGAGGRVRYISSDWREIRVEIPLSWRTRNYVGTIYGGSMYGAVDPIYMLMLIKILGPEYVIWDKAANIRFRKPGRDSLFATFEIGDDEIGEIKQLADVQKSVDRIYNLELKDKSGVVHAQIEKTLYIARKEV
jgi:acyl-coenzyme A thioesterase PaaI-like protein